MTSVRPALRLAVAALFGFGLAAGAMVSFAEGPSGPGFAPDPPARASTKQWTLDVYAKRGKPELTKAVPFTLQKPAESPRVFGRFAVELYVGKEILDRVRFDIPLAGGGPGEKSPKHPFSRPSFDAVTTRFTVRMADHPRATYLLLVDRATRATQKFVWPPEADGRLVPWTMPKYDTDAAWPPPPSEGGAPKAPADAGRRD